jgi:DNA polymerase III sliding clamp (beta) subunit (PCNA family)
MALECCARKDVIIKKLTVNKKQLSQAATAAARFSQPRSPLSAMQRIRVSATSGLLTLECNCVNGYCLTQVDTDGDIEAIVDAAAFCRAIDSFFNEESVDMSIVRGKMVLSGSRSTVDMPTFTEWQRISIGKRLPESIEVDSKDLQRCINVANVVGSNAEVKYANGVRLFASGGRLELVSSTSVERAFTWCDCSHGDFDTVASRGGTIAISKVLAMSDTVKITDMDSHIEFCGRSACATIPKESVGTAPATSSSMEKYWKSIPGWCVNRQELSEFIRLTLTFATPEASGVWMEPRGDGVFCRYTGLADGTHTSDFNVDATCETFVAGVDCTGDSVFVSSKRLAPAVAAMESEGFVIKNAGRAIFLESSNSVIGIGAMNKPGEMNCKSAH